MKRLAPLAAALAWLSLPPGEAAPAPPAPSPTAESLVAGYNGRSIGAPGARRLHLELRTGGAVSRTFDILHLWRQEGAEVRSLVLLERPEGLRGTSYLLVEDPARAAGIQIFLLLAAGKRRVLEVLPGRFDEGLLGSDFAYSDLLWMLPMEGRALRLAGQRQLDGGPAWVVEALAVSDAARRSTRWTRILYQFAGDPPLLRGADYYAGAAGDAVAPDKRLRVLGWHQLAGAWTPSRMVMTVHADRASGMTLLAAAPRVRPFEADLFTPGSLPRLAQELRGGGELSFLEGRLR